MMRVKTAKGRTIDMAALAAANEKTRAVGNVPINARGDRLGSDGRVIATVENIERKQTETRTNPQKRKMSQATRETAQKNTPAEKLPESPVLKSDTKTSAKTKNRRTKTRDDGTKYIEIEHDDGSIETKEIE